MKLVGCMAVRNEAWCLGLTLRAALQWCDEMVVLLHACTDDSERVIFDIQDEHPGRLHLLLNNDPAWNEMEHRQEMLRWAREKRRATHIAIVDADELVTGNMLCKKKDGYCYPPKCLRCLISGISSGLCLQLPMYQLRGSLDRYHANGIWGNRWLSVAFQDDPRLSWSGDKFHSREPQGMPLRPYQPIKHGQGGSFHLWGVSERRLRAHHAWYKIIERLRWPGKSVHEINNMYNLWRTPHDSIVMYTAQREWGKEWTFADVPAEWWKPYCTHHNCELIVRKLLDINAEPWQIAEIQRLVAQHGAETFKGLDLFGIAD